ncbi:MAG TPA: hypothetical protein VFE51_16240 [Verrucomicrobiae bacterium]|nr:hypothetical protein [Verrucomicrobiae bacterium]
MSTRTGRASITAMSTVTRILIPIPIRIGISRNLMKNCAGLSRYASPSFPRTIGLLSAIEAFSAREDSWY